MMKKLSGTLFLLLLVALINVPSLPWKLWAYGYAQMQLAAHDIKADFTIERLEPGVLVLKNITSEKLPVAFDELDVRYAWRDLLHKKLVIHSLSLTSKDGVITTKDVSLDFNKPVAGSAVFTVNNVPLALIMKLITAGRADATGTVSGTLPLTYHEDGSITVKNGVLTASKGGSVKVAPEAIPGDNDQVDVVRAVLTDFRYDTFTMTLDSDKDKKLSILLQLHGNNPSAYNGREVKLNVRLQGDLLDVYKENITAITNPTKLLEQHNEKNP